MNGPATVPANIKPRAALVAGERPAAIVPQTIEQVWRLAELSAASGLAPKDMATPEKCAIAILHGLEVGLPPMQALQRIAVINGRPSIWGDAVLGLVRASRLLEYIREEITGEGDTMVASCTVKRIGDDEPVTRTFSVVDAKTAALWNKRGSQGQPTPWVTHPKRMLQMRARAFALRDVFPDVTGGMYLAEEAEDMRDITPAASIEPPEPTAAIEPPKAEAPPTAEVIEPEPPTTAPDPTPPEPETSGTVVWEDEGERAATTADQQPEPTGPQPEPRMKPGPAINEPPADPLDLPAGLDRKKNGVKPMSAGAAALPKIKPLNEQTAWLAECQKSADEAKTTAAVETQYQRIFVPYRDLVTDTNRAKADEIFKSALARVSKPAEPQFDAAQWLKDLDGAASGCNTLEELSEVQTKVQLPAKKSAALGEWKKACSIMLRESQRIMETAEE